MTNFNKLVNMNTIVGFYKNNKSVDALCLLWNKKEYDELLATEDNDGVLSEQKKGVLINGK